MLTLERLWRSHGCLTTARHKVLRAHLEACAGAAARPRPGSYTWPTLRAEAEERFSAGAAPDGVIRHLRSIHAAGPARPLSIRTMRRWCAERRWLTRPS